MFRELLQKKYSWDIVDLTLILFLSIALLHPSALPGNFVYMPTLILLVLNIILVLVQNKQNGTYLNLPNIFSKYLLWWIILAWLVLCFYLVNIDSRQVLNRFYTTILSFTFALTLSWLYLYKRQDVYKYLLILLIVSTINLIVVFFTSYIPNGVMWSIFIFESYIYQIFSVFERKPGITGHTAQGVITVFYIGICLILIRQIKNRPIFIFFLTIVLFAALIINFLSGNRASLLALIVVFPLLFTRIIELFYYRIIVLIALIVVLIVVFLPAYFELIFDLFIDTDEEFLGSHSVNTAIISRSTSWLRMLNDLDLNAFVFGFQWDRYYGEGMMRGHPHNIFYFFLTLGGVTGVLLFSFFIYKIGIAIVEMSKSKIKKDRFIINVNTMIFTTFLLVFMTNSWGTQTAPYFGLWISMTLYMYDNYKNYIDESEDELAEDN